jgi:hypothetical protein
MTQSGPSGPGWFPDPDGTPQLRWWDGNRWTGNVAPAPISQVPAPQFPAPQFPAPQFPAPQFPAQQGLSRASELPPIPTYPPSSYPAYNTPPSNRPTSGPSGAALTRLWRQNRYSGIATGVAIVYIFLAIEVHFVVFGFLPILFTVRAWQGREPLAFIATGACVLSLIFLVVALKG